MVDPERVAAGAAFPDLDGQGAFCRDAEAGGIDSLLVDMSYGRPEPLALALALARETERVRFMVASRPGLMSPTLFVQQVNTFAALARGRISLNVFADHSPEEQRSYGDGLGHDERYARLDEWLSVCRAFWERPGPVERAGRYYHIAGGRLNTPFLAEGRLRPEIYLGGSSPQARAAAARHADCWLRFADAPEAVRAEGEPLREAGVEIGLCLSVFCRPTREEALRAARALAASEAGRRRRAEESAQVGLGDADAMRTAHVLGEREWLTPWLWTGLVRVLGAPWVCLTGTPADLARGLLEFRDAGASQFILSGEPGGEELARFVTEVLPLVRAAEGRPPAPDGRACR
jgi:alkanesulfonate monooxygenase